jgi:hypothetical protein
MFLGAELMKFGRSRPLLEECGCLAGGVYLKLMMPTRTGGGAFCTPLDGLTSNADECNHLILYLYGPYDLGRLCIYNSYRAPSYGSQQATVSIDDVRMNGQPSCYSRCMKSSP